MALLRKATCRARDKVTPDTSARYRSRATEDPDTIRIASQELLFGPFCYISFIIPDPEEKFPRFLVQNNITKGRSKSFAGHTIRKRSCNRHPKKPKKGRETKKDREKRLPF